MQNFKHILVHAGTNNVSELISSNLRRAEEIRFTGLADRPLISPPHIFQEFIDLINTIWEFNSECIIIFSAIIPRPCDHQESDLIIRETNSLIKQYCNNSDKLIFNPTYRWFESQGWPIITYYSYWDRLHLSEQGVRVLTQALQMALADRNIELKSHSKGTKRKF